MGAENLTKLNIQSHIEEIKQLLSFIADRLNFDGVVIFYSVMKSNENFIILQKQN